MTADSGGIPLDRLPEPAGPVQVLRVEGMDLTEAREPHRHDYHELIWISEGSGEHLLDGRRVPVRPGAITIIGRGSVHVFQRARGLRGAIIRFSDESVLGAGARRAAPGWLLAGHRGDTVPVAPEDVPVLEAAVDALAAESAHEPDGRTPELQGHLLAALLLWIDRWHDAAGGGPEAADPDVDAHHRFTRLLEAQFAAHHDAGWYADALGVPSAALSRALAAVTGRSTKELITDRLMLEAMRLLRFTDLSVGEIAYELGFADPFYFSRAFKRNAGHAPMAYRDVARST
jgi:AraC family transcriptional activator of pobA